jgi:hypothetical protein
MGIAKLRFTLTGPWAGGGYSQVFYIFRLVLQAALLALIYPRQPPHLVSRGGDLAPVWEASLHRLLAKASGLSPFSPVKTRYYLSAGGVGNAR